jgi:PPOX class probable F420-dependent enzyme
MLMTERAGKEGIEGTMLDDRQRALLDLPAFAKLVTLMPDGHPQGTVMWYRRVEDTLRMIAPASAVKVKNLERDPRSTVIVDHPEIGYTYIELRCHAEVVHDDRAAREELFHVAKRYVGDERAVEYVAALSEAPRVILVFHPTKVQGQFRDR